MSLASIIVLPNSTLDRRVLGDMGHMITGKQGEFFLSDKHSGNYYLSLAFLLSCTGKEAAFVFFSFFFSSPLYCCCSLIPGTFLCNKNPTFLFGLALHSEMQFLNQ